MKTDAYVTTLEDLRSGRATVPVYSTTEPNASGALGIRRTLAYRLLREDKFPVPIIRVGRLARVSSVEVLKALGADQ